MSLLDIFLFVTGVTRLMVLNTGGELFVTDLLLSVCFLFLIGRVREYLTNGLVLLLMILGALWLLNAIITDIYRRTPFEDWSRGWAMIIFFLSDLFALILLTQLQLSRISVFTAGIAFSYLIEPRFFPQEYLVDFSSAWKFAYSQGLTMLAALLGMTILARRLFGSMGKWLPLALLGIANLAFNYRSMFGIAMAAVAFGMLKDVIDLRPQLRAKITPAFFVVLVGGGLAFSQGMIAVYETAADNGWLGLEARDKYLAQTSGDLSLLQSGRAESLVSTQAIADSPIIGHGSWAKDYTYVSTFIAILESKGFEIQGDPYASPLIPEHSFLLGAWVNAGIMGGVFWLAVIGTAMKALYVTLKRKESPATFVGFILFSLLWDVMFSPFGAAQRFLAASKICVALWALRGQTSAKVPSRRAGAKHLQ